jgi:hypothetical protein
MSSAKESTGEWCAECGGLIDLGECLDCGEPNE